MKQLQVGYHCLYFVHSDDKIKKIYDIIKS
ncbi:MAG: hypothetical protein RLY43_279 [Bacteroidota bacterium]